MSFISKQTYFDYLNTHTEFLDMNAKDIKLSLMKHFNRSYSICAKYYLEWKRECLGLPQVVKRDKAIMDKPTFKKYGDCLISKNGEYSLQDGGLLLTKGKAYLNFGNKEEFLKFFNEAWTAYERLEEMEC